MVVPDGQAARYDSRILIVDGAAVLAIVAFAIVTRGNFVDDGFTAAAAEIHAGSEVSVIRRDWLE